MRSDESSHESPDSALESILDRYLTELADGQNPDQAEYLRAHPEHADALRGIFRTLDFVEGTAAPRWCILPFSLFPFRVRVRVRVRRCNVLSSAIYKL